jgi:hypothetical protein
MITTYDENPYLIEYCPLHAAAPELLAALEHMLSVYVVEPGYCECERIRGTCAACEARSAISKAEGRSE